MLHCVVVSHWLTAYTKWSLSTVNWYNGFPDSKVHVAHMGPTWVLSAPCWPHEPCYQACMLRWCVPICASVFHRLSLISIMHCGVIMTWTSSCQILTVQDDIIKWKHFLPYWSFMRGIYQSLVNSPHKGQRRGAWIFSLICTWTNRWGSNRDAGDLRCCHAHYDVTAMRHPITHPWGIGHILWV